MTCIKNLFSYFLITVGLWNISLAQPIQTGDKMPPHAFEKLLNDIGRKQHPPKLIILDFWSTGCAVCIAAFPKMADLQKRFGADIQIVLANNREDKHRISTWSKEINIWRKTNNLSPIVLPALPLIVKDSKLGAFFPYAAVPHHVWISNEGEVLGITGGKNTNEAAIEEYLRDGSIQLEEKKDYVNKDITRPLFLDEWVDASQIEQYSILVKGKLGNFSRPPYGLPNRYSVIRKSLHTLYTAAASKIIPGLKYGREIIDVQKPTVYYAYDSLRSKVLGDYLYVYDLVVPASASDSLYHYAISDLNRYTNYYGRLEKRVKPCYVIVSTPPKGQFTTTGGEHFNSLYQNRQENFSKQRYINGEWGYFFNWVSSILWKECSERAIVDESGILGNIDIEFDKPVVDYTSLRKQLKKYNLDILEADREIEVFVLSDKAKN